MPKMTESELKTILGSEERSALGYMGGKLSEDRRKALNYYLGEPFGNEMEGRSQVVSTDVADTIEWILPSLLKIFTAGDDVVRFEPQGPEDEQAAKQATEYVNWIFNRDNPGFMVLYTTMKDALMQKNGIGKVWWEEEDEVKEETLPGLPEDAIALFRQEGEAMAGQEDAKFEVLDEEDNEDGTKNVTFSVTRKTGKCRVEAVPPEEFLISRKSKTIEEAEYVAHRVRRTASELIEMGYDQKTVDQLPEDEELDLTAERVSRYRETDENLATPADASNRANRQIWVTEAYIKVDFDGDGIAERRKVTHAGAKTIILDNEEWEGPTPFFSLTPIVMPHTFIGRSVADMIMDLQLIKSTILRQILDNLYLANNGRHAISDKVNLDDMLVSRPGGVVRLKDGAMPGEGHILPLETQLVASQAFPMLEYLDTVRENRTGVTRYNQGIDANSLNKTASGISQIMTAAQQRIELIARLFAETGVKELFRLILYFVSKYQDKARVIRLRNTWVPMDPNEWKNEFDMSINVGLGTGNRDQMLAHLMTIVQAQAQVVTFQGGADGPIVTKSNVYNALNKLAQNSGFKNEGEFFTDPANAPPQQPKPDPETQKAQAEMQLEQQKAQHEDARAERKNQAEIQHMEAKAQLEARLAWQRAETEKQIAIFKAKTDAKIAQMKAASQAQLNEQTLAVKAASGAFKPKPKAE